MTDLVQTYANIDGSVAPGPRSAAYSRAEPEFTPVQGIPVPVGFRLEPGERIVWQGRPGAGALLRHLFKGRWLAAYLAGLLCWKIVLIVWVRGFQPQEATDVMQLIVQGAVLSGIVAYFARALARSTTYTLTDLRLVIHHGVALPGTVDIPLRALRSLAVRVHADGTGDVALGVRDGGGIGYAKLWPHVRGWSVSRPEPMLRGLPDATVLGTMLARRLEGCRPWPSADAIRSESAAA